MSAILDLVLGIVTSIGGFVEVGSISTSAQAGAEFGFQLLWAVAIAAAMLMDRLNLGVSALFGKSRGGKVARWDRIDISDPTRPRLTCSIEDLAEAET